MVCVFRLDDHLPDITKQKIVPDLSDNHVVLIK